MNITRSIVLVGLMGSGKSSVGRRLAEHLGLGFVDVDDEIERAADRKISEIFEEYGEAEFRALEKRVLARLLDEHPRVIATGGGAFVQAKNQKLIKEKGVSLWLDAELETLWERVQHKTHRPLLTQNDDPKGVLAALLEKRNPEYSKADHRIISEPNQPHMSVVEKICKALGIDPELA